MDNPALHAAIKHNCDVSDARDNGIYSLCTLFLKLRNLYKWEHGLDPWQEPAPRELLPWIEAKETYWATLHHEEFRQLPLATEQIDPFHAERINPVLQPHGLWYGAGFGRAMKAVFFLAEVRQIMTVAGCRTIILGHETVRELAAPFAMLQEHTIFVRREPLRFFFWDQIQELRASGRPFLLRGLRSYDVLPSGTNVDQQKLAERLDIIVDNEIPMFIRHEVGEMMETRLDSATLRRIAASCPDTPLEFLARSIKDGLADTHPEGLLAHIVAERKTSSLCFYVSFLDGLRKRLLAEVVAAAGRFLDDNDWERIERAVLQNRGSLTGWAEKVQNISSSLDSCEPHRIKQRAEQELLVPLGLAVDST